MSDDPYKPDYDYVAYVDEAGDPGLKNLRPDTATGSSEWFVLAGIVLAKEYELVAREWVAAMIEDTGRNQRRDLHFRDLHTGHKNFVCSTVANYPVRCFAVCSHKKSLLDWPHNPVLKEMRNQDWFYAFLSRYLLERITHFVGERSRRLTGSAQRVKVVFSERGGLNVGQMAAYYDKLENQTRFDAMMHDTPARKRVVLGRGNLDWETVHPLLLLRNNHKASAGLQLADVVASSFFQACDQYNTLGCNPSFARLLRPRMARAPDNGSGRISGYGLKVAPGYEPTKWLPIQGQIFADFGYPDEWWAPVPSTPSHL